MAIFVIILTATQETATQARFEAGFEAIKNLPRPSPRFIISNSSFLEGSLRWAPGLRGALWKNYRYNGFVVYYLGPRVHPGLVSQQPTMATPAVP